MTRQPIPFLISALCIVGAYLFVGLWLVGTGEWTFLAGVICAIIGLTGFLYMLTQLEKREGKLPNRRTSLLVYAWLALAGAGALFFGIWKANVGEWAISVSGLFLALFMFGPPVWFIIQPDLAISTFGLLTGNRTESEDWKTLSASQRFTVYAGTLICLAIGILLLLGVFGWRIPSR